MVLSLVRTAVLLSVASIGTHHAGAYHASADSTPLIRYGSPGQSRNMRLLELPAVARLFAELARERASMDEGERVASWVEFSLLVEAVVGDRQVGSIAFEDLAAAPESSGPTVAATPALVARDDIAYRLLVTGYSARETADVVSGRISQRALDTARKMLMVGRGRDAAANYLDGQYRRALAPTERSDLLGHSKTGSDAFGGAIEKYARLHGVDAALIRAVIAVESAFNPRARSSVGAIGLMQLMPATARALGVDPLNADQNIEGEVRYLSELLRMFGGIELALVAYNGGPGFARRYARGESALYGETRDYVKQVLARLRVPR